MEDLDLLQLSTLIIPLVIAITMHEAAHGFVANMLGDNTAKRMGRVTLNPLRHVDPFGTIVLPGLLIFSGSPAIGWAKPVPVNFYNLRNIRWGSVLVALAGPGTNILLALLSALALHLETFLPPEENQWLYMSLYYSVTINVILAVFNMLPLLPLDGGRVLSAILPGKLGEMYARSERFGMLVVLLLFIAPYFLHKFHIADINPAYYLLFVPADFVRDIVLHIVGIGITH